MKSRTPFLWLAPAVSVAAAWQQTPILAVDARAATPPSTQRREGVDGGATPMYVEALDDSIPLPVAAVVQPGPTGDVVVQPASGDPFFLGFVAGKYYPPAGERIDPALLAQLQTQYADGRPSADTYAFVMFDKRITPARVAALEDLGCRVIKFHPHYTMKVALPVAALDAVAALDFVHWVGVAKPWQKVHTHLTQLLPTLPSGEPTEVYISVFESDLNAASTSRRVGSVATVAPGEEPVADVNARNLAEVWMSNGWQQRALEGAGLEVVEYIDRIHAFRAKMLPAALESVVALDFVQFVEADVADRLYHDESTPAALADDTRVFYPGDTNLVAITGEIDSGIESAHSALNHVFSVGWNYAANGTAFDDGCAHGTHVAGTIYGLPDPINEGYTGNAPHLGSLATLRLRNVRRFEDDCSSTGTSHSTLYSHMRADYVDGSGNTSAKPHAINNSWGSDPSTPWVGTEANAVTLDSEVWDNQQLYVFAAGNNGSGAGTIGLPAVAKNAFTIGAVLDFRDPTDGDPGQLCGFSSRGPCGDGRWKPNVCAPGQWIRSADAGNLTGFFDNAGTSMAAPHVTGLAGTLADHHSFLRYAPWRMASLIMATAMTNNDVTLTGPGDSHLDNFGAGRINSTRAHWSFSNSDWTNWGFTLSSGSSTFGDFTVAAGTTRLVVCMHYEEDAASTGASQALVNDIDLWIDDPSDGIQAGNNTGNWFAQQSSLDNTEIRILNNPTVGTWRWKNWSQSTSSSSRVGITVVTIDADTTPDGTLTVSANDTFVQPNTNVTITATATNPAYFASNVFFDSTSAGDSLQSSSTTLYDGLVTDLSDNQHNGRDVLVGSIYGGSSRTATWVTRWATEGVKSWCVDARSDNWVDENDCVNVTVDGTAPGLPGGLHSTSHTVSVWSNDNTIDFDWNAATDNLSGVDGYGVSWGNSAGVFVGNAKDTEETVTNYTTPAFADNANWYFAVKTGDNCGNWTASTTEVGPYKIDTVAPTQPGVISSTTHTVNVQSCATTVTVNWTLSTDALSGINHYWGAWNTTPVMDPVGGANIAAGTTSNTTNIGSSTNARYFHLRPLDNAGNFGPTRHFGPIYANSASVVFYCTAKTNSLGCVPAIGTNGLQPDKSNGTFAVTCTNVLNQKNGLMYWGFAPLAIAFQGGIKCVASPTVRGPNTNSGGSALPANDCTGAYSFTWTTAYMNLYSIDPGDTIFCQFWTRDPAVASTTGLSNAVQFTVCQ